MSLCLSPDTLTALGGAASLLCENRSLFFDRYANPSLEKDDRKAWFNRGRRIIVHADAKRDRDSHFPGATMLYARLQARLMVNMAGGVMENAGLCLDRYGMPYIPGSTVKGCARRMALQALHDWCTSGAKPADDDLCVTSCKIFSTPAEMLAAIALVFGWVEQDWAPGKTSDKKGNEFWKSDFGWACQNSGDTWQNATTSLCGRLKSRIKDPAKPWDSLPNFAGSIAFLPAYPNQDPGVELDIVTCHHGDYYSQKTTQGRAVMPVALDTEEPVPVIFPAIAAQKAHDHFAFPLFPLRGAHPSFTKHASNWLASGLESFGLGAKTNSGFGWFDASEDFQKSIVQNQNASLKKRQDEDELKRAQQIKDAKAKDVRDAKAVQEAALAGLTPEQREDKLIEWLSSSQFESKFRAFCKDARKGGPGDAEKPAIVRALRGPRLAYWQEFKIKAVKGDLAAIADAVRILSKTMNLGKMP